MLPQQCPLSLIDVLPKDIGLCDSLLHPLVVEPLGQCLRRADVADVVMVQPFTLRAAALALQQMLPHLWATGNSVCVAWQDGTQVSVPSFSHCLHCCIWQSIRSFRPTGAEQFARSLMPMSCDTCSWLSHCLRPGVCGNAPAAIHFFGMHGCNALCIWYCTGWTHAREVAAAVAAAAGPARPTSLG